MMTLLHLLSYVGALAAFLFVTLSLASGLLWLAELIEEHSRYAKTVGMRAIYTIIILHLVLCVTDRLPLLPILFSVFCHVAYLTNFSSTWPYISLTSPRFLLSCCLVVADHFTWFFHFAHVAQEAKKYRGPKYRYGGQKADENAPAFMDVAAFFAICVWFVPLFLFLSLSANDNALPSFEASAPPSPSGIVDISTPNGHPISHRRARRESSTPLMKSILVPLFSLLPRLRRKRREDEGIIAPRTPIRGSPLHSPVIMPQSYFPWADDSAPNSNFNLSPEPSSLGRKGGGPKPPPPRRIQSEAQAVKAPNPRGLAVHNGRPPAGDGQFSGDADGGDAAGLAARRAGATGMARVVSASGGDPGGPAMSLGPEGGMKLAGGTVLQAPRERLKMD